MDSQSITSGVTFRRSEENSLHRKWLCSAADGVGKKKL